MCVTFACTPSIRTTRLKNSQEIVCCVCSRNKQKKKDKSEEEEEEIFCFVLVCVCSRATVYYNMTVPRWFLILWERKKDLKRRLIGGHPYTNEIRIELLTPLLYFFLSVLKQHLRLEQFLLLKLNHSIKIYLYSRQGKKEKKSHHWWMISTSGECKYIPTQKTTQSVMCRGEGEREKNE